MDQPTRTTTPDDPAPRKGGCVSGVLSIFGILISVFWLLNLSMGLIEVPDNLPFIGNLDEVFFSAVLFSSLARWGIYLPWLGRRIPADRNKRGD